jgi:hypothetical protein
MSEKNHVIGISKPISFLRAIEKEKILHLLIKKIVKYCHRLEFWGSIKILCAMATIIKEIKNLAQAGFQKFD